MKTLLTHITFAKPYFLWLMLALPLLWFRFRDRRLPVLIARTIILALVIFTLADPQSTSKESRDQGGFSLTTCQTASRLRCGIG